MVHGQRGACLLLREHRPETLIEICSSWAYKLPLMSEPTATTTELAFDARRYIDDRARIDAQERRKWSPETLAFFDDIQRRRAANEQWIAAGMRQERREEVARRLRIVPRRTGPAQVVSIASRQPA